MNPDVILLGLVVIAALITVWVLIQPDNHKW